MEPFSVFFKEHSMFRAFKLDQNISAKNIFLLYKESSLYNGWLEINKMANIGIFFLFLSDVTINPNLVETQDLYRNTIMNLLNISAIIKNLDIINKK
jgi:hypothetical protein